MTEPTRPRPFLISLARAVLVPILVAAVATAGVGGPGWHRVKRGDTLSELAVKYGTTVDALRDLNKLGGNNLIITGQWLRVGRIPTVTRKAQPAKLKRVATYYTVRNGDGLIRIAERYKTDWHWIAKRNKVAKSLVIHPGQRLVVKEQYVKVGAVSQAVLQSKGYARHIVAHEARRLGVPVDLALALAYMESGFQQKVTSSVGAVGVMQVMLRTGEWVSKHLAGRRLDLRDLHDNVTAGLRYFKLLLRITGRADEALAGYYQGLTSVRKKGMYDDTKRYVKVILALRNRF